MKKPLAGTLIPFVIIILVLFIYWAHGIEGVPVKRTFTSMSTYAEISVPERQDERIDEYMGTVRDVFAKVEKSLTIFKQDSEIGQVNTMAGAMPVPVSLLTQKLLEQAYNYGELSGGAFDVTIQPLMKLWRLRGGDTTTLPTADEIAAAKELVGYQRISFGNNRVMLSNADMAIDLGGIAKGYAVDLACQELLDGGLKRFMVNLGGNIKCVGTSRNRIPWAIGVQNPFDKDELIGALAFSNEMAVATSGNYERFVTIKGKSYSHLIDPRSGRPVEGMAGVTVISSSALEADAISTALFVLGVDEGQKLIEKLDCEALFIPDERPMKLIMTDGFADYFTPVEEYDNSIVNCPSVL